MGQNRKIKVLVVDDSMMFRELISKGISSDPNIEVVAKANDAYDARDKILEFEPDVMTCDVQMPRMDGIEFIKRLLPQYPLPVVVVSIINHSIFDAMSAGAVDFVSKPDLQSAKSLEVFVNELIIKIKVASVANVTNKRCINKNLGLVKSEGMNINKKIIAMGSSTGGTGALYEILKVLPPTIPGIVIVQHIPPVFSRMFAERLNSTSQLRVKEAETGDILEQGAAFIAPGDKHMRIKLVGDKYKIECFEAEKVNGHCPSVDVLFESVAKFAGDKAIGIILTGMGYDGAKGLLSMRRKGARTIGQNEKSSVVYGMPKVAYELGAVEKQCSLEDIPQAIFSFLK